MNPNPNYTICIYPNCEERIWDVNKWCGEEKQYCDTHGYIRKRIHFQKWYYSEKGQKYMKKYRLKKSIKKTEERLAKLKLQLEDLP